MLFWRARLLALLLLSCTPTQVCAQGNNKNKNPPPTPSPTKLATRSPSLSPSVRKSLSPTEAKLFVPSKSPSFVPTQAPSDLIQQPVVTLKRHEVSISSMTLLLGPALSEFSEVESGLIEQVTETHLIKLFNAKYKNNLNVINLNSIPVPEDSSRRKLQSSSTKVAFDGTGVLFASNDLENQAVNDYILFEAFEDGNGQEYLDSLNAVLSESDLSYVSASKVTITPSPGTEEPSSSESSSSFWDNYGIYIIIILCCIAFLAMIFSVHAYRNREKKSGGVIDANNRSFKLTDEGSTNSRSYSRQRFFEKVEVDHEANNTSAAVDPFEFEHNLDQVEAPPAAQDFRFQQDPEEDRRANYYAERDKYNANYREQEKAIAKGRALANVAQIDPAPALGSSPSSLDQHNLGPIMEEKVNQSFSTTSDSSQRQSAFISPLSNGKYGKYYESQAQRIQLQPSDEETIHSLSPRSPKLNHREPVTVSPSKLNNMPPPPIPMESFRNAPEPHANPPPPAHLQQPLQMQDLVNTQCAVDMFSQYLTCGIDQGVEVSHLQEPAQEQIQMQQVTITAPIGKLGVYLDGSADVGEPCRVHGLKPASVLQGKLYAGDVLVRINEIDVTGMEAVEVSKLLSRSNKKKRRITVLRASDHPTVAAAAQNPRRSGSVTNGGATSSVGSEEKMKSIVLNAQRSLSKQRSFSKEQPKLRKFRSGREIKGVNMVDDDSDSDLSDMIVDGVD